jgi:hypothetical protein
MRVVESRSKPLDQILDLWFVDDERRTKSDRVTDIADDKSMVVRHSKHHCSGRANRTEGRLLFLVGNDFDSSNQSYPTHFANDGMIGKTSQSVLQVSPHGSRMGDQTTLFNDPKILQPYRRGSGMTRAREAVRKHPVPSAVVCDDLKDLV